MLKKHLNQREIKTLNDITDIERLISRDFKLVGDGDNKYCHCPFHEERTPSFCIVTKKNFYYCFGCGAAGYPLDFLKERYRRSHYKSTQKALTELLNFNNISVKELKKLAKEKYPNGLPHYGSVKKTKKGKVQAKKNRLEWSREVKEHAKSLLLDNPEYLKSEPREIIEYIMSEDNNEFSDDIPF